MLQLAINAGLRVKETDRLFTVAEPEAAARTVWEHISRVVGAAAHMVDRKD